MVEPADSQEHVLATPPNVDSGDGVRVVMAEEEHVDFMQRRMLNSVVALSAAGAPEDGERLSVCVLDNHAVHDEIRHGLFDRAFLL